MRVKHARAAHSRAAHSRAALTSLALIFALTAACAPHRIALPEAYVAKTPAGPIRIEYAPGEENDAALIQRAVALAAPSLARWGAFDDPITLRVVPTHAQLEEESGMHLVGWLRAWARHDAIIVQRPQTWSLFGARPSDVETLLLHELTHALMYQLAATARTGKKLPLWFREGMALVTAGEGARFVTLEDLARYFAMRGPNPLTEPELFYRDDNSLLYGAAFHAFNFLVRRYGDESVKALLKSMRAGESFTEAFQKSVGISEDAFVLDFVRFVRWRAFAAGRLLSPPSKAVEQ